VFSFMGCDLLGFTAVRLVHRENRTRIRLYFSGYPKQPSNKVFENASVANRERLICAIRGRRLWHKPARRLIRACARGTTLR
jgi:hypothetical protein